MSQEHGKTAWAVIVSTKEKSTTFGAEVAEFATWYMNNLTVEALKVGIVFNFKKNPTLFLDTDVGDFESCSTAYQSIFKTAPETFLVLHILPEQSSSEHTWMKSLCERYGFIRQGLLYENVLTRYATTDVNKVFRNMAFWIHRSSLQMVKFDQNPFLLRVGRGEENTVKKLVFNREDIHEAVTSVLHGDCLETEVDHECSLRISGFPPNLNSFGLAQLLTPFRVLGVSKTRHDEAIVSMENIYHAIQACEKYNGHVLDRVHTLKVEAIGKKVLECLEQLKISEEN